jgi:alpha-glucosidase
MRFWLDRGVDGFRCDAVNQWLEDDQFRDEPMPAWRGTFDDNTTHIYTSNQPGNHDIIRQMRAVLDQYDGRVMIGETYLPNTELVRYYGAHNDEFQLPFNFQLIAAPWEARTVRAIVDKYEEVLPRGAWPNWVLGNHDNDRVASRIGPSHARLANMLLLTLRGTPTTYYGEEIGIENVPIPGELRKDPMGRDPERTPMQWDSSPNAGFTQEGVSPWLPVSEGYAKHNVAQQETDPTSMLNLYRALTRLRRIEPALYAGCYASLDSGEGGVFAYLRTAPGSDRFLVVLNFTAQEYMVNLSQVGQTATIAVATDMKRQGLVNLVSVGIGSNEGLVLRLK